MPAVVTFLILPFEESAMKSELLESNVMKRGLFNVALVAWAPYSLVEYVVPPLPA